MTSFSVVTPTLEGGLPLRRCVGSVRGQRGVTVEHLIQDGASSDGSVEWLRRQPHLLVQSSPDAGMYDAINRGFARASGDILSWLNADEQYLPGMLSTVAAAFAAHPQVDFVYGNALLVSESGEPLAARRDIGLRRRYLLNGPAYAVSCTLFFRRRLWEKGILAFDSRYRAAGDYDLLLRLLGQGCRWLHLHSYIGLFGITGHNLSATKIMTDEIEQIRAEHGAYKWDTSRRLVLWGRYTRRLLAGCYRPAAGGYDYALDEFPIYRRVEHADIPSKWTFNPDGRRGGSFAINNCQMPTSVGTVGADAEVLGEGRSPGRRRPVL